MKNMNKLCNPHLPYFPRFFAGAVITIKIVKVGRHPFNIIGTSISYITRMTYFQMLVLMTGMFAEDRRTII